MIFKFLLTIGGFMKKITLLSSLIALTLIFTASAQSAYTTLNCTSLRGSNNELLLFVGNQNLLQARIIEGFRQRVLPTVKLANQNIEGVTLYSITSGGSVLLEVENQILDGENGKLQLSGDTFSCIN